MANVLGGSYMGATVARRDFFHNAQTASEREDREESVTTRNSDWKISKFQKWKMEIQNFCLLRRQFRWKRIDPLQEHES